MKVKIVPSKNNKGPITLPASKSLMHRALICAAFANGMSVIKGININDDILATISCLENLGICFKITDREIIIYGKNKLECLKNDFYPHESGSTLRFIIPFVNLLDTKVNFYFEGLLGTRPLDCYLSIWDENKIKYLLTKDSLTLQGKLQKNEFTIKGNISSQFVSGLLMMLPLHKGGTVKVLKPFESQSYVNLTVSVMKAFGVDVVVKEEETCVTYQVRQDATYQSCEYLVEADYSQSAFFLALGMLNSELAINNLNYPSLQGDSVIIKILKEFATGEPLTINSQLIIKKTLNFTTNLIIDLADCPDLGPILMTIASLIPGKTTFINTKRLVLKESNRALSMKDELSKIGAAINVYENEIIVNGCSKVPYGQVFDSHKDHRICMSLAILATVLATPSVILDSECINKSYPTFFNTLEELNIEVHYE